MGTKSKETLEDPAILKILSGMQEKIAKLQDLPETVTVLSNRVSSLESRSSTGTDTPEFPGTSGNTLTETQEEKNRMENNSNQAELKDQRIAELETQLLHLESPEHRENIILEWLNTLDQDSYYALGVRKGYLEEINPPAEDTTPGELREPEPEVQFSKEKPEDPTGWAYSETLKGYIRIAEALNE